MRENKQPILSICIPTRNRWYSLQYTLKSIIDQDEFKSWYVEIVISDNASTDKTETEIKKLCKNYDNIVYYRNKENMWFWPNIINALSLWRGEYLWLLGSDDFLALNALWNTLNCIKKYKPTLIYSRREEVVYQWSMVFKEYKKLNISLFNWMIEFTRYLWDRTKLSFHDKDVFLTFMSAVCVKGNHFKKSYNNLLKSLWYQRLIEHSFNFSLINLSNIEKEDVIAVIVNPICVYCDLNHWRKPNRKIANDLKYLVKSIILNYHIRTLNSVLFFLKLCCSWYIWSGVVPFLKKYKLYSFLKKIYHFFKKE